MGRIKSKWMKTVASRLIEAHPDKFSKDFDNNKDALNELNLFDEKRARNKIAGTLVKKMKKTTL
jgi:small subunit ribosomal protein S17e